MSTVDGLTYSQYISSINNPNVTEQFLNLKRAVDAGQISPSAFAEQVELLSGKSVQIHRAYNGDILGYTLNNKSTVTTPNPINSNASTINRGTVSMPVSTGVDATTQKAATARLAGLGTKVATGAAMVGTAAMCVGAGITLGKTFDSALYNLNPDFFDSINMSTLNPETWQAITAGQEGFGADLLNVLFGFDPNTGEGQAYIDERALAYFAAYMQSQNAFAQEYYRYTGEPISGVSSDVIYYPFNGSFSEINHQSYSGINYGFINPYLTAFGSNDTVYRGGGSVNPSISGIIRMGVIRNTSNGHLNSVIASDSPDIQFSQMRIFNSQPDVIRQYSTPSRNQYTKNNKTVYFNVSEILGFSNVQASGEIINSTNVGFSEIAWSMVYGDSESIGGVEGIGTQSGATTPQNLSTDPATALQQLQTQYPDLWQNALQYPVIQPDGTVKNYTYVPVAMPDFSTRTDTQPTTGPATQQQTQILPDTFPQELVDTLTQVLQQPSEETGQDTPPDNPTDTGEGSSPVPVPPTGAASALWAIYHPTQAEIDSFGAWLWSPSFIDQIAKIFNNPMESIIGLHKIYATPVDAGTSTIVVGYLDSQVSSAYITQQYVDVDCGSVNLSEQFGNVFDYAPFTSVKLYLPFIGIVSLDVSEVMRSTISISYGVDVLTGACLARVNVARDANNSILYQFAGNCAVQYPLSMGSYMGIVSSILGVAGSAVATFASGGSLAPLAIGAASAAFGAHTSVQNSGNFSGNAGAMGGKKPYLIIKRPQTRMADGQETYIGTPTNYNSVVGDYSGFVRASSVHLEGVNATDTELNMIQTLLEGGILA